ncbi:HAMP domain-containing sensor histidine kinase [Hymenobacter sp. ASUV-10]|uniref:histidine kinase n=1 Tax=Hymenobacter aranciens TaxID=3063996 RepID=A0ABT9B8A3_9BACT|nr:HAMP domain-containing sensor histidine kinase [Hymenobacter sp. ASUV-10]MDO7874412.1 HAMP domain-containing sensor histidine kinase [Hymenobacter sp. ASUV-10]
MRALRGLRSQLALAFALVFGLALGLAGLYQYRQVGQVLHQADDARLRARAYQLLEQVDVSGPVPALALPGRHERARVVAEGPSYARRELFHSPGFGGGLAGLGRPWRGVRVQRTAYDASGWPVRISLELAHPAAPLTADLRRVRLGLWAALAGSLALAAGLAAGLGWWVLRPLRRISRQAGRIGAAPGAERLPEPATGDEVQELAQTLNRMLDRLQAGAELQDNFLAAAAHELRTPLAVVQAGLAVTRQDPALPAHLQAPLAVQAEEVQRLSRLVDDFLLVSRLRAGALPLHRQPLALDELVLAVADRLLPRFRAAGRPLHLAIDEQVADYTVAGDADKLTTVLLNLLENALRHAPPGREVRVQLSREEATGWYRVAVANPIQHSLGDLSRLTTAYYQAEVLSEGAGLGLWLSNRLAELHGAPLALSEAEGEFVASLRLPPG